MLALLCVLGPFAFAAILNSQSGSPSDSIFGVWVHSSGFAIPLVVLAFAGSWGFPVLAGVLAGDIFSAEDRYGTWKTVLTRSCRRRDLFIGKVLAAATFSVGLIALLAVSSLAAGLLLVGDQPLVGLSGALLSPGRCIVLVLASWLLNVLPMLGFASLAMLLSVASRNGIAGVLGTILAALVMQLLALVGTGTWVHGLLLASAFDGWHGLFTAHPFYSAAARRVHRQRRVDHCVPDGRVGDPSPARFRRHAQQPQVRMGDAAARRAAVHGTDRGPRDRRQLGSGRSHRRSPDGQHRPHLQQPHAAPATAGQAAPARRPPTPRILAHCGRRSGTSRGPGDDWFCTVDALIAQPGAVPFWGTPVTYDVSVKSNGCYKAEAPPTSVGNLLMRDAHGRHVVNPLATIYGCFNTI